MTFNNKGAVGSGDHLRGNGHHDPVVAARMQVVVTLTRDAPPGRSGVARVLWRGLDGAVHMAEVTRALTLGRAPGCAVELSHASVAWVHALLGINDSTFWIVDLSSTGGTTVNGIRVGEILSPLRSGDVIELGGFPLAFVE